MSCSWGASLMLRLALGLLWGLSGFSSQAQPLTGGDQDYDALLAMTAGARVVMLGEATHGSREFYRERVRISRRLIEEQGFGAVVLEAPWEPVRRLDAYIRGEGRDADAAAALGSFARFPDWPTRNSEIRDFVEVLRAINRVRPSHAAPVRLYGMDLYSLPESADAVVRHVARHSIAAAAAARQRYLCFDDYLPEPMLYGREAVAGRAPSCAEGAAAQLAEMPVASVDEDDFLAWQSARVVSGGESYYRALYRGESVGSWNLREQHMAGTVDHVLERMGPQGRVVVWGHNLHQGDARATGQAVQKELSVGQLMRERHGEQAVLVGLSTWRGRVRAAPEWGARDRVSRLRPALRGSWHEVLRRSGPPAVLLIFRGAPALAAEFAARRLERAVGVIHLPRTERKDHYFYASLSGQFDAVIHLDITSALDSLGVSSASRPPRRGPGRNAAAPD
ncbi:MAG: erythromycin esterase family protein [Rhodocyclales bacterium]|nr:erythromycin esterase family protein [Rhodocyclales bacterium]